MKKRSNPASSLKQRLEMALELRFNPDHIFHPLPSSTHSIESPYLLAESETQNHDHQSRPTFFKAALCSSINKCVPSFHSRRSLLRSRCFVLKFSMALSSFGISQLQEDLAPSLKPSIGNQE
ncbi:hypothetical protein L1887_03716 [Cichorium endivia]|nr:hypothetical protein L1887_03716 [Cichorium endivia]